MHIRKLAPPDRDQVLAVLRSDGTFQDEEVEVAMELLDSALAGSRDYHALVCVHDADDRPGGVGVGVAGYVCYGHTPMTVGTFDLYWIATHRDARGRGVATLLVNAMERELWAQGARIVRIETSQLEAYGAARSFYARHGYVEVGRIRDFYRAGDDLVTLAKHLEGAPAWRARPGSDAPVAAVPPAVVRVSVSAEPELV
jgi:ribosomal protein S18 acetylase RimI-like enzyme